MRDWFASVANSFSAAFGGPYVDGYIQDGARPVFDDGGSLAAPSVPAMRPCRVQFDAATDAMRAADGFAETDVRMIILASGLCRPITSDSSIVVQCGPRKGVWSIQSVELDAMGTHWICRGRAG